MRVDGDLRTAAVASLRKCCANVGLMASGGRVGHTQVWARDSMIAVLGASLVTDARISQALRDSLALLRETQAENGCIPNNVDSLSRRANFRATADGGLWWIIGSSIISPDLDTTKRILRWYECQDVDDSGLLSMQESSDWQDLFCTRGKGLYLNCLYVLALESASRYAPPDLSSKWRNFAQRVRDQLNRYFWYHGDGSMLRHIAHTFSTESPQEQDSLGRKRWLPVKRKLVQERYYLPYLAFRTPGEWFDVLGHLLALLAGVPDPSQAEAIVAMIARYNLAANPAKSLFPSVQPEDADWRDYYGMLNIPDHYHNGGIWPFIGGFWIAALVKYGRMDQAGSALAALEELNRSGNFNEWHHGTTVAPMGVEDQAWSAAMYLYADECYRQQRVVHLG